MKNRITKPAKGLTPLKRDKFIVGNVGAIQTGGARGARSRDDSLKFAVETVPTKGIREDISRQFLTIRERVGLSRIVKTLIKRVGRILKFGRTNGAV